MQPKYAVKKPSIVHKIKIISKCNQALEVIIIDFIKKIFKH